MNIEVIQAWQTAALLLTWIYWTKLENFLYCEVCHCCHVISTATSLASSPIYSTYSNFLFNLLFAMNGWWLRSYGNFLKDPSETLLTWSNQLCVFLCLCMCCATSNIPACVVLPCPEVRHTHHTDTHRQNNTAGWPAGLCSSEPLSSVECSCRCLLVLHHSHHIMLWNYD